MQRPLTFASYLRDPVVDEATGEVVDARPCAYEALTSGPEQLRWVLTWLMVVLTWLMVVLRWLIDVLRW